MADTPDPEKTDREVEPRPFGEVLAEIEAGFLQRELSERLHNLVTAVVRQAKPGTLTLKLEVKPVVGQEGMCTVVAAVGGRPPVPSRAPSSFFLTRGGNLSRQHPSQMTDPALQPPTE